VSSNPSADGGSSIGPSASGWYVEIDHPSGYVHTPTVIDDPTPQRNPAANGLPSITIPVRHDERWSDESFEKAPLRVWKDGDRQPVDRIEEVEQTERATVISGRGGLALQQRVREEVREERSAALAERLIEEHTPYTANVDRPKTTREDDVFIGFSFIGSGRIPTQPDPASTDAVVVDGNVRMAKAALPQDAYRDGVRIDQARDSRPGVLNDGMNAGVGARLDEEGDRLRFTFETEYDLPVEHVGIKVRDRTPSISLVDVQWDGASVSRVGRPKSLGWHEVGQRFEAAVAGDVLKTGEEHELVFEVLEGYSNYHLDVVALYDKREEFTWPNPSASENQGGILPGPQFFPKGQDVHFEDVSPPRAVVGASIEASGRDDGSGIARVLLSNDGGRTYRGDIGGTDPAFEIDWDDPSASFTPLVSLVRYGDDPNRGKIPTKGFKTQALTYYQLAADLEDAPLTVNRSFDDTLETVLADIADDMNAVWEFRREGTAESVEWTQPGQRTVSRSPAVGDYSTTKTTVEQVEKVVIYGKSRDVDDERHTYDATFDSVALKHDHVEQGSVEVTAAASPTTYRRGDDYTIAYDDGKIVPQTGGRIADGDRLAISYTHQYYGEYTAAGAEDPTATVQSAPKLASGFACRQAARAVIDELGDPLHRFTLTVSGEERGFSVVQALAAADLPGDVGSGIGGLQIKEVEHEPGEARLRGGSHRTLEEVVDDIERSVAATSREV